MQESGKYWVALAVNNSIPRPDPDEEASFVPMYFNASPVLVPADGGEDAVCVFSTEGKLMAYMDAGGGVHEAANLVSAVPIPLRGRDDFRELFACYPASHVALDPLPGTSGDAPVSVDEFLDRLED